MPDGLASKAEIERMPTVYVVPGCCASTTSGAATIAPAILPMNVRRSITGSVLQSVRGRTIKLRLRMPSRSSCLLEHWPSTNSTRKLGSARMRRECPNERVRQSKAVTSHTRATERGREAPFDRRAPMIFPRDRRRAASSRSRKYHRDQIVGRAKPALTIWSRQIPDHRQRRLPRRGARAEPTGHRHRERAAEQPVDPAPADWPRTGS